jgi:predicted CXXCH cytochrome family protein
MKMLALTMALIPLIASGASPAKDSCFDCHSVMEGTSAVFKDDVHYKNTISCADCHGGDPKEDTANASMSADRGFKVRVTRQGTPDYCGRCHSDTNFMVKYNPQERVDQLALYKTSIHAKQLAAGKKAAECVDCHSVHNIRAVSDPLSPSSPQHVTDTCAKCHTEAADLFKKSPHGRGFTTQQRPGCVACHDAHATQPAGTAMLTGATSICARCHRNANSGAARAGAQIAQVLAGLEAAGPGSKAALERARVAVHTFNVAAVRKAAEPPVVPGAVVPSNAVPANVVPGTDAAPK